MTEPLTVAKMRVMWHQFTGAFCPVCRKVKPPRNCFCRTCYFAVKHGDPKLAAGLWVSAIDHRDEFFEKYSACAEWLRARGMGNPTWNTTPQPGDLFA